MTKELDEIREEVERLLCKFIDPDIEYEDQSAPLLDAARSCANRILFLSTDKLKVAVVRKEGELPKNKYGTKADGTWRTLPTDKEEMIGHNAYTQAQRDMLSAGFVQEVKDE